MAQKKNGPSYSLSLTDPSGGLFKPLHPDIFNPKDSEEKNESLLHTRYRNRPIIQILIL